MFIPYYTNALIPRCFWIGCNFSKFWLESNGSILLTLLLKKTEKCNDVFKLLL